MSGIIARARLLQTVNEAKVVLSVARVSVSRDREWTPVHIPPSKDVLVIKKNSIAVWIRWREGKFVEKGDSIRIDAN